VYARAVEAPADGFAAGATSADGAAIDVPDEVRDTVRDRLASQQRMVFRLDVERVCPVGAQEAVDGQA
jgi:hypothetical protein